MSISAVQKIIHVDADSFYVAIELCDRPELRHRCVAVGGSPSHRGVIATCNYNARRFGVHSAMASAYALRLCPDLVILQPNFDKYRQASLAMRQIFSDYTNCVEPLSLDEAYLDVTASRFCGGSATLIAEQIRQRINETLGITVSAGVASCKFIAKIASDWNKPDGLMVVTPAETEDFLYYLPVGKISGVGAVTAGRLKSLGIETCGQLRQAPLELLVKNFSAMGKKLHDMSRGIDDREVQSSRQRKSLSVETTFAADLRPGDELNNRLRHLLQQLDDRYETVQSQYRATKRIVKVKFADFSQSTIELKFDDGEWRREDIFAALLKSVSQRANLPMRLLGVGLALESKRDQRSWVQLPLNV